MPGTWERKYLGGASRHRSSEVARLNDTDIIETRVDQMCKMTCHRGETMRTVVCEILTAHGPLSRQSSGIVLAVMFDRRSILRASGSPARSSLSELRDTLTEREVLVRNRYEGDENVLGGDSDVLLEQTCHRGH